MKLTGPTKIQIMQIYEQSKYNHNYVHPNWVALNAGYVFEANSREYFKLTEVQNGATIQTFDGQVKRYVNNPVFNNLGTAPKTSGFTILSDSEEQFVLQTYFQQYEPHWNINQFQLSGLPSFWQAETGDIYNVNAGYSGGQHVVNIYHYKLSDPLLYHPDTNQITTI